MWHRTLSTAMLLGLLAAPNATGEELTLAGAMARARSNAREVAAARARADASAQRLQQAKAHRLPRISAQEIWMRTDSPADAFGLVLNQERFSLAEFARSNS